MNGENNPEYDAQILADAEVIKANPGRLEAASSAAKQLAKNAELRAAAYRGITKPLYEKMQDQDRTVQNPNPNAGIAGGKHKR